MPRGGNEAFSRVVIDALLADVGWNLIDGRSVRNKYSLAKYPASAERVYKPAGGRNRREWVPTKLSPKFS